MKNKKTINRVLQLIRPYTYLVVSILVCYTDFHSHVESQNIH